MAIWQGPPNKLLKQPAARRPTARSFRAPLVSYHGRGHRYLLPRGILLRPLLSSDSLGGRPSRMGHQLVPRSGTLPPYGDIVGRLRLEFAYVRTDDAEDKAAPVPPRMPFPNTEYESVLLGREAEFQRHIQTLRGLGCGDALYVEFGDDAAHTRDFVLWPGHAIMFGYEGTDDELTARPLVDRTALVPWTARSSCSEHPQDWKRSRLNRRIEADGSGWGRTSPRIYSAYSGKARYHRFYGRRGLLAVRWADLVVKKPLIIVAWVIVGCVVSVLIDALPVGFDVVDPNAWGRLVATLLPPPSWACS